MNKNHFLLTLIFLLQILNLVFLVLLLLNQKSDFNIILERFARNRNYSREYNCVNYSKDLSFILNNLGYQSKVVCGERINDSSKAHCWVRIYIDVEPQTAKFVDYSNIYKEI